MATDIVQTKLKQFNLVSKQHIITVVTGGASVMKKMGRLMGVYHQICHSHGIHLDVAEVLYIKQNTAERMESVNDGDGCVGFLDFEATPENYMEDGEQLVQANTDADSESDDEDDTDDSNIVNNWLEEEVVQTSNIIGLVDGDFSPIIYEVRKIARLFENHR